MREKNGGSKCREYTSSFTTGWRGRVCRSPLNTQSRHIHRTTTLFLVQSYIKPRLPERVAIRGEMQVVGVVQVVRSGGGIPDCVETFVRIDEGHRPVRGVRLDQSVQSLVVAVQIRGFRLGLGREGVNFGTPH